MVKVITLKLPPEWALKISRQKYSIFFSLLATVMTATPVACLATTQTSTGTAVGIIKALETTECNGSANAGTQPWAPNGKYSASVSATCRAPHDDTFFQQGVALTLIPSLGADISSDMSVLMRTTEGTRYEVSVKCADSGGVVDQMHSRYGSGWGTSNGYYYCVKWEDIDASSGSYTDIPATFQLVVTGVGGVSLPPGNYTIQATLGLGVYSINNG